MPRSCLWRSTPWTLPNATANEAARKAMLGTRGSSSLEFAVGHLVYALALTLASTCLAFFGVLEGPLQLEEGCGVRVLGFRACKR